MSKIGKTPIEIKAGVQVSIDGSIINASGIKGQAVYQVPSGVKVQLIEGKLVLTISDSKNRMMRAIYGLTRANIANMIKGIDTGFEKKLEIQGVGYRAQMQGSDLMLSLGFSHQVKFHPESDVKITVADNIITISGTDKVKVGLTASKIRDIKPPEPYKGKGIRYVGELVKRKVGKAAKAVGAK